MRLMLCALASLTMTIPALAQDKSKEVVGSEAKVVLKTSKTMLDKPITLPQSGTPELTMMVVTLQSDGHTSLHKHPNPTFGYVMDGAIEVRADNVVLKLKAGETFVEPIDSPMQLWNTSPGVTKLLVAVVGNEGTPVAVPVK